MAFFELPELDVKKTKEAVEEAFAKYRIYKYHVFEERETSITSSLNDVSVTKSGTSDQTANVAIYNADVRAYQKSYCERVEKAVNRLPHLERFLIEKRYMGTDAEYIPDYKVYNQLFQPPISEPTYAKLRKRAFYKLALSLNIEVLKREGE
ncbi:ArpU family phage packaging/lysis transcriptional regulator [Shouchella clausii]|uniref:ArpU family phage packaging/lysis transcriptional regulator n=1 Tax=Shouchella clausii TaxID=79880 RepID=UPI000AFD8D3B|nr:ArpU family phage packaging/lysis transcriptional regulator [Shouchella clausii]